MEIQENISPNVSEEPMIEAPEPVKELEAPKDRKSGYVVGILLFLIISLMGGLAFYVLKDNGVDLLSSFGISNTESESTEDNSCVAETCTVSTDNEDWDMYSVPEYGFSVEIPTYTMTQYIGSENVTSVWKINRNSLAEINVLLDNYLSTINLSFYPTYIPEGSGCGQGCVNEHIFYVNVFSNADGKDLDAAVNDFTEKWNTEYAREDVQEIKLTGEKVDKWDTTVWSFNETFIDGSMNGYLVATDKYIYDIEYFLSMNPTESYQIALKVLDSMKFDQ